MERVFRIAGHFVLVILLAVGGIFSCSQGAMGPMNQDSLGAGSRGINAAAPPTSPGTTAAGFDNGCEEEFVRCHYDCKGTICTQFEKDKWGELPPKSEGNLRVVLKTSLYERHLKSGVKESGALADYEFKPINGAEIQARYNSGPWLNQDSSGPYGCLFLDVESPKPSDGSNFVEMMVNYEGQTYNFIKPVQKFAPELPAHCLEIAPNTN